MTSPPPEYLIDSGKPLSQSLLWTLQRRYFESQGVDAWRANVVPYYITSNPYIAQAYARLVLGYLRDLQPSLDPAQPVYLLELGAGAGRFAYHFLIKFHDLLAQSPLAQQPVCYILTDLAEPNLAFWQAHPAFQDWLASGKLDFARFDAVHDREIHLRQAGRALTPGALANPLVLIANYFFDSLPQDAFHFEDHTLAECQVSLVSTQPEPDPSDPAVLPRLTIRFQSSPCRPDYYQDPALDDILDHYRARLAASYLVFPAQGIRCLRHLADLAGGRLLLLSGDTALSQLEQWEGHGAPDIRMHGSFSIEVNYHAIGQYVQSQGGQYLSPDHPASYLTVCAFALGGSPTGFAETRLAYAEAVQRGGPDDFFLMKSGLEKNYTTLNLDELLAYLRFSGWDGRLFLDCFPALLAQAPAASPAAQDELARVLEQLWRNYYHLDEERDLPFNAGVLLFKLGRAAQAQTFFERSQATYGPSAATHYNLATCCVQQRKPHTALSHVKAALALDPTFEPALALYEHLQKRR